MIPKSEMTESLYIYEETQLGIQLELIGGFTLVLEIPIADFKQVNVHICCLVIVNL